MGAAVVIVGLVLSAASAAMSYKQSQDTKEAQEEYNLALKNEAIRQYTELDSVENDAIYESHAESLQAQRELMEARSSIELGAAVTGTYGNSINIAIEDLHTGFGGRMAEINYNREAKLDEVDRQAESLRVSAGLGQDRTVHQPAFYSALSTGLSTYSAVSGVGSRVHSAYQSAKPAVE